MLVVDPVDSLRDPLTDGWATSPIDRMEELLRAATVPVGVVTDGRWWAIVSARPETMVAEGRGEPDPLPAARPQVYEAAVTVMMRVVFLLFAEERGLLPQGRLFAAGYGISEELDALDRRARTEGSEGPRRDAPDLAPAARDLAGALPSRPPGPNPTTPTPRPSRCSGRSSEGRTPKPHPRPAPTHRAPPTARCPSQAPQHPFQPTLCTFDTKYHRHRRRPSADARHVPSRRAALARRRRAGRQGAR